jgi:hypothetical protein
MSLDVVLLKQENQIREQNKRREAMVNEQVIVFEGRYK